MGTRYRHRCFAFEWRNPRRRVVFFHAVKSGGRVWARQSTRHLRQVRRASTFFYSLMRKSAGAENYLGSVSFSGFVISTVLETLERLWSIIHSFWVLWWWQGSDLRSKMFEGPDSIPAYIVLFLWIGWKLFWDHYHVAYGKSELWRDINIGG